MSKNKTIKNSKYTKWLWIVTIFVFICFIAALVGVIYKYTDLFYGASNINKQSKIVKEEKACENCIRRYIDGVYVRLGEENLFPIAVIIENHVDARPQSGLAEADLVYEAEAEGGITRFLAIYADNEIIEEIGPIRSARPYFLDWAREFSSLFVHSGGSPEALVKIAKENFFNINEFYNGKFFWRDSKKYAPHNLYTSTDNLNKYLELKNKEEGKFLSWKFKEDLKKSERPETAEINIDFQLSRYIVKWEYDRNNNEYVRYGGGEIHKDKSGKEIKAKNIIIEYVNAEVIDNELRLKMEHIGEGDALICLDGKCEEGQWRKKSSASRTRFYKKPSLDKGGTGGFEEEFKFNAGATWIEVVRPEYNVIVSP